MAGFRPVTMFSVVKSLYCTFENVIEPGLFVVIYADNNDESVLYKKNMIGLKITSKPTFMDKYFIAFQKYQFSFLDKTSWVQCSKLHVLDFGNSEVIGHCPASVSKVIYQRLKEFLFEMDRQLIDSLPVTDESGGK